MGQLCVEMKMLNRYSTDEMCDATEAAQRNAVGYKAKKENSAKAIPLFIYIILYLIFLRPF
jgi:hypothetical protein